MYLVTIYDGVDDTQGTTVHTPYTNGEKLSEGKISLVGDGIDSFDFSINPSNPAWNRVRPLTTLIDIVDVGNNKTVFDGRILKPVQTMSAGGQFNIKYVAESKLAYLRDSTQPHGEINNMTVKEFLEVLISNHNADLEDEPHKHFEVGEVTVTTSTDNVYRFLNYEKTWDAIQDKLVSRLGGHIRLRDGKYIDYLDTVGELKETPIEIQRNLKDMQKEIDPTGIITKLKPLGARIESEEASVSEPRVDIKSVNEGKDYLIDEELVKEFGIISESMIWDNVNVPSTVKLRGQQFFQAQRTARVSYNVTVPNMHLIDLTFEEITVDDWYPIINPVFAVDEPIQVIGKEIDINSPQLSKLQIGDKYRTLSEYQAQANRQMVTVERLEERVERLGGQNAKLNQQLSDAQKELSGIQDRLLNADIESLPEEIQAIGQQIIGLQQLLDNLEIPEYEVATPSSDGLMSHTDKGKLNLIHVTKIVDLDDVLTRLETLEQAEEGEPTVPPEDPPEYP